MTISPIADSRLALVAMLIENEETQANADREQLKVARAERRAALVEEAESLREAANSMRTGALVSASFSVAGGLAQIGAGSSQLEAADASYDLADLEKGSRAAQRQEALISKLQADANKWKTRGETLSALATPAGALANNQKYHEADAAQARVRANDASDRAEDARSHREKVDRRSEALLDAAGELMRQGQAARDALLRNG